MEDNFLEKCYGGGGWRITSGKNVMGGVEDNFRKKCYGEGGGVEEWCQRLKCK